LLVENVAADPSSASAAAERASSLATSRTSSSAASPDKHVLDILCGTTGAGEADRRADPANPVNQAVGRRNRIDDIVRFAGQVGQLRSRVLDLASERGRKALTHRCQTIMKKVGLHVSFLS
jgi:hypothetical protein